MLSTKILTVFLLTIFTSKSLQLTVDCDYKISKSWKVVEDVYSCFLTTLDIKSKLHVTNVTGTHLQENTNSDVKALKIIGGCEIISSGFGSIFPNIEAFSVWKADLKYISNSDLQQFNNLREIWIYVNSLEYLESTLFQYNPKVEIIYFNQNNIKYIGGNFFDYLPQLQKASFLYNDCIKDEVAEAIEATDATDAAKLNAIKDEIKQNCAVNETTKSLQVTVDCEYKESSGWTVVKETYGCFLITSDIKGKVFVMNATGTHLKGNTNSDVKSLNICGGICTIIPSAFDSIFPNIEALSIWNTTLKLISSRDLQQFGNLREIWVYSNEIDYLESNLFEYNPKVEVVVFKNNKIQYIGEDFFDYLPNLRIADFWFNDCINGEVTDVTTLNAIKGEIKQNCALPGTEPRGYTTISPDGLTYWVNVTSEAYDEEGVGGINVDGAVDPSLLKSLVG